MIGTWACPGVPKCTTVAALKVLHPQLTADPRFIQRFRQDTLAGVTG